jgi:hypothetical protein
LRCGQCGTWRRVVVSNAGMWRHAHDLDRDRRAIEDRLRRLQASDLETFASSLRNEILSHAGPR